MRGEARRGEGEIGTGSRAKARMSAGAATCVTGGQTRACPNYAAAARMFVAAGAVSADAAATGTFAPPRCMAWVLRSRIPTP